MAEQPVTKKAPPPPPRKLPTPAGGLEWEQFALPDTDVLLRRVAGPPRAGVPAIDPHYHFRENMVRELAWAVWPHDGGYPTPCLLVGPKGCGKTSLIKQIAARCNIVVQRTNLHVGTTVRHLKGRVGAEGGSTVFVPGIATMAMEEGSWLILDEISGATPPVALSLFPILEPDGEVLLEDAQPPRYVHRHPDFRVFATDNTIGAAQEDTRFAYAGTNPEVNEALLDRFGSLIQVDYLDVRTEFATLQRMIPFYTKGDKEEETLEGMCRVASQVRESPDISVAFSMRMVIEWARRVAAGSMSGSGKLTPFPDDNAVLDAAGPAFLDKVRSKVERTAIEELIRNLFDVRDKSEPASAPRTPRRGR